MTIPKDSQPIAGAMPVTPPWRAYFQRQERIAEGVPDSTDDLPEGSSNLYFTTERAQDAVGAAIAAGSQSGVSVSYDDATGAINFIATGGASFANVMSRISLRF